MPSLKMKTKITMASLMEKICLGVCQKSSTISKNHAPMLPFLYKQQSPTLVFRNARMFMEFVNCMSNLETIFSPSLEPTEVHRSNNDCDVPGLKADNTDNYGQPSDYQTCSVSDFFILDMIIACLPCDGSAVDDGITKTKPLPDYKYAEPSMLFEVVEECMIPPFLENTAKLNKSNDTDSWEKAVMDPENSSLYLAIHQIRSCNQESDIDAGLDQEENFDPQSCIKKLPEHSNVASNFQLSTLPKQSQGRKYVTLVLDLDASPSIYAEQLLDILDPERRLTSRRVYRESCIFSDGTYTKDLTVLGVDLAKVAIIDNSPQVFRLQVNNGIPIKSWFSDPLDCALISSIPFLETLVEADDVCPIIAKRIGNRE